MAVSAAIVVPVFSLYALSGFVAAAAALLRPFPGPPSLWRAVATVGLLILALGTGLDNLRTMVGAFAFSVPDGVFELRNTTLAADFLAQSGGAPVSLNYVVSLFCFFSHEVMGSFFLVPGMYLLLCAAGMQAEGGSSCLLHVNRNTITAATVVLLALGLSVGIFGFSTHTATAPLALKWNGALSVWSWGAAEDAENPFGLFGVFESSGVWIVVGVLLWLQIGLRWFFWLQLAAFFGQGASAGLGEAMGLSSNLCEQLVTWALLGLGWQLRGRMEMAEAHGETSLQDKTTEAEGFANFS